MPYGRQVFWLGDIADAEELVELVRPPQCDGVGCLQVAGGQMLQTFCKLVNGNRVSCCGGSARRGR